MYNGLNPSEYEFNDKKSSFMLFMGRILREKGVLLAIEIAERTNKKLIIAGPIKDKAFFRNEVAPRIKRNPHIHFVGAVGGKKNRNCSNMQAVCCFQRYGKSPSDSS